LPVFKDIATGILALLESECQNGDREKRRLTLGFAVANKKTPPR